MTMAIERVENFMDSSICRFVLEVLGIEPTGVEVASRYRPAGHVSQSRQARYFEADALHLRPASSQAGWGSGDTWWDQGGGSGWWQQGASSGWHQGRGRGWRQGGWRR